MIGQAKWSCRLKVTMFSRRILTSALVLLANLCLLPASAATDPPQSELARVLSAAIHEYSEDGTRYEDLYQKYQGIRRKAPKCEDDSSWIDWEKITPGSTLDQVLKSRKIRFGFWRHEPYYMTDAEGHDTGFEYEMAPFLVGIINRHYPDAKLKMEWVEKKFDLPGAGQDNVLLYEKLLPGLQKGEYDVAFSGLIVLPDRPVSHSCPTMEFFWDAIYTGKDGWDMKSVQNTDTQTLAKELAGKPSVKLLSTAGGPSEEIVGQLAKEINAAGGKATTSTATVPGLLDALKTQNVHIVEGDAIALSSVANQKNFKGLNLNIMLRRGYSLAPITRPDSVKAADGK